MKKQKKEHEIDVLNTLNDVEPEDVINQFFIVGLGGSAGGLEAYEEFFNNLPPDTGAAYVMVMHLDPKKKGLMPELIQRNTNMPVQQITDGLKIQPDNVYVIPSDKDIIISKGSFKLLEPTTTRGVHMPIDTFLKNLAEEQKELSVAILFSGMGTDGSMGVKSIKEKNGLVMVQDPSQAKFEGLPTSAISTGMVDYIAPANKLPGHLVEYIKTYSRIQYKKIEGKIQISHSLDKAFDIIRRKRGYDFSVYKKTTVSRRIERRMSVHQIDTIGAYIEYIQKHPEEADALFKELLISVTNFFRDPEAFKALEETALPELIKIRPPDSVIRVWVPGCSTGEEAFSIAIILSEMKGEYRNKIQIFATDIDRDAIEKARKGIYPDSIAADVSQERLQRFFIREGDHYKVKKHIREMIVFAEQDIVGDPPFTNLDLLSCRNLLIYLTPETQKHVLSQFTYAINPGGILFLGPAETIGTMTDIFSTIDNKWKLYKRKEYVPKRELAAMSPVYTPGTVERANVATRNLEPFLPNLAYQALLENLLPPAALIRQNGDIVYISGHTGKYLELAPGKIDMNIIPMARKGIDTELMVAIDKAKKINKEVSVNGVEFILNGKKQAVDLLVKPISKPEAMKNHLLITFQDFKLPHEGKAKKAATSVSAADSRKLADELEYAKQRLRATTEEMQASREEMRSMNEEMQSTNEELQSTNEELTTSKEELQSLNEELITVNSELQAKIDDLTTVNNDMRNLLNSTDIATIFLDRDFKIVRFTGPATKIINLILSDMGRPISDISTNIKPSSLSEGFIADASHKVLDKLIPVEKELETNDGRWYIMRILPYRTVDNVINGVVLTFNDVTDLKRFEQSTKIAKEYSEAIIATVREPLIVLDSKLNVVTANKSFYQTFLVNPAETEKQSFFTLGNGQWNIPELKNHLEKVLPRKKAFENFKVVHDFPGIGHHVMILNGRSIETDQKKGLILLAIEDMTGNKKNL